ncbi:MAG TPA: hypothetical protein VLC09_12860 [Polyangiaceae bacterium]|nr:hypothetical protein [Polyangiaceae bacterium]
MTNYDNSMPRAFRSLKAIVLGLALGLVALVSMPDTAQAEGVIKRPGAHNQYKWELEPQLAVKYYCWNGCGNAGFGPGVRASIPFMHNGPIDSINNNIGISFGLNTFFYGGNNEVIGWNVPVAFQWNFYFTEIISVLGEVGLNSELATFNGGSDFDIYPLFQGGGRFQFGKLGVLVRVGIPYASVGLNIQF